MKSEPIVALQQITWIVELGWNWFKSSVLLSNWVSQLFVHWQIIEVIHIKTTRQPPRAQFSQDPRNPEGLTCSFTVCLSLLSKLQIIFSIFLPNATELKHSLPVAEGGGAGCSCATSHLHYHRFLAASVGGISPSGFIFSEVSRVWREMLPVTTESARVCGSGVLFVWTTEWRRSEPGIESCLSESRRGPQAAVLCSIHLPLHLCAAPE